MPRFLLVTALAACTWIPEKDAEWRADPWGDQEPTEEPCEGGVDDGLRYAVNWYPDLDLDHYGMDEDPIRACSAPEGYVGVGGDCDDADPRRYPTAAEICNEADDDCDEEIDEDVLFQEWHTDADLDGYGAEEFTLACADVDGAVLNDSDCVDADPDVHPDAEEVCNGIDDDCDIEVDENLSHMWYADLDGDGYGDEWAFLVTCEIPDEYTWVVGDCDDADYEIYPDARERCNGIDDDCDGELDDLVEYYVDADGDTFGDPAVARTDCEPDPGEVPNASDCDDAEPLAWRGAAETCDDDVDNDCDGLVDRGYYYADSDGDGLGERGAEPTWGCAPAGLVGNDWDCDDADAATPLVADPVLGLAGAAGTLAEPLAGLQEAVDSGTACVVARAGTYAEALDLDAFEGEIRGVDGDGLAVIDPAGVTCGPANPGDCLPAVRIAGGLPVTMRGFTVTGGTGAGASTTTSGGCTGCSVTVWEYCGGGVYVSGTDVVLEDLFILDNVLPALSVTDVSATERLVLRSAGGGLCVAGGSVSMRGSVVTGGSADVGGGAYVAGAGALDFAQGYLSYNAALDGAALFVAEGTASLGNAVVSCNAAADGAALALASGAAASLGFVTLAQNAGTEDGAELSGAFSVADSILQAASAWNALSGVGTVSWSVLGNTGGGIGEFTEGAGVVYATGTLGAVGCADLAADDYRLYAGSAAVDAASGSDADGSAADAGAFGGPDGGWE